MWSFFIENDLHDVEQDLIDQFPWEKQTNSWLCMQTWYIEKLTRNWSYVMISMPTSLALARISEFLSSGTFLVNIIRFNVGTCLTILSRRRIFSTLSTKIVFNEAKIENLSNSKKHWLQPYFD